MTGTGTYLDDIRLPGTLHLNLVRSPIAHGRITEIDLGGAEAAEGVRLVLTPSDVADLRVPPRPRPERRGPARPALARDVVRMVGDPVVAIVAESAALARDAADLVFVDFDELPVVADPEAALSAPAIYPEYGDNIAFDRRDGDKADIDGLDGAIVVEGTVDHPRVVPAPLETRGCIALWEDGRLVLYLGTQAPALMADELAWALDLDRKAVRVVVPDMGGAFGSKFDLAEEELLAVEAARRLGSPVKWVEGRREHFQTIGHGRAQRHRYKAVADRDGRLLGLWVDSLVDIGARKRYLSGPPYTPRVGTGNYDIPLYAWRQRGVFTNRAPRGIYRGAGRPEATLTIELIMDRIAVAAGIDPAEVRRRNFVSEFPFESPGGAVYDSGDYFGALDKLLDVSGYAGLRRRQAEVRAEGGIMGIGLGAFVESTAFERSEKAVVCVDGDGAVEVRVGTLDHGQGHRTTFAQLVATEFGLDPARIEVVQGDTDRVGWGYGTSGSRSLAHGGSAAVGAAREVADKMRRVAAHLLEADAVDIVFRGGRVEVGGAPGTGFSFEEVAAAAQDSARMPEGESPGLEIEYVHESPGITFPFGMHLAVVTIDRDLGTIDLEQVWAVDDIGVVVNPMIAIGQRHGGLAQGIGQALAEQVVYDDAGNLLTSSFMDYLMPAAAGLPPFRLDSTVTPSPNNPLGVKGVGEAGTIGIPPAIVNAVLDALRPFGVEHIDIPLLPEKVWRAIRTAEASSSS